MFTTCPRKLITRFSYELIDLNRHYKNGVLPFAGGLYNQPNWYVEAMTIIEEHKRGV